MFCPGLVRFMLEGQGLPGQEIIGLGSSGRFEGNRTLWFQGGMRLSVEVRRLEGGWPRGVALYY